MNIRDFGWDSAFADSFDSFAARGLRPARVISSNRDYYRLIGSDGEFNARLAGKISRFSAGGGLVPVVGDWVAVQIEDGFHGSTIRAVVARRTSISRKVSGWRTEEQVFAANIDTMFIVNRLDDNFSLQHLELNLAATPAADVPIICVSAVTRQGFEQLDCFMRKGKTLAFTGSSGFGKATTRVELIRHESGSLLLDTPELRELMPCRIRDWHHKHEKLRGLKDYD